jgi:hypothetical protein
MRAWHRQVRLASPGAPDAYVISPGAPEWQILNHWLVDWWRRDAQDELHSAAQPGKGVG